MDDYEKFLGLKTHEGVDHGFDLRHPRSPRSHQGAG